LFAAPIFIAFDRINYGLLHLFAGAASVEHSTRLGKYFWIVDFKSGIGCGCI